MITGSITHRHNTCEELHRADDSRDTEQFSGCIDREADERNQRAEEPQECQLLPSRSHVVGVMMEQGRHVGELLGRLRQAEGRQIGVKEPASMNWSSILESAVVPE